MSSSQSYPSLLYPQSTNGTSINSNVLPAVADNTLGGNAANYMSKAVGGSRRRRYRIRHTIIRDKKTRRCKSRRMRRHRRTYRR